MPQRILVVEDDPDLCALLCDLLNTQGYSAEAVQDGATAIRRVATDCPDAIVLDVMLPEMDGFQVVQELRNNPETATIPILVVTGDDSISNTEREQLMNLSVLHKGDISADEYHQFIEGVRSYLNGD